MVLEFVSTLDKKTGGNQFAAAYTQNTTFGMKQTGYMRLIQARQKFTHCQIAGRAKQHKSKFVCVLIVSSLVEEACFKTFGLSSSIKIN